MPHITLKSIANNAEIDVIWERLQEELEPLRDQLNAALGESCREWEIPREAGADWPQRAKELHAAGGSGASPARRRSTLPSPPRRTTSTSTTSPTWTTARSAWRGPSRWRASHRTVCWASIENDELIDHLAEVSGPYGAPQDFAAMILETLKTAGVQQAHVEDRISFSSLAPWPGDLVCAEGRYVEGPNPDEEGESGVEKRAAIFIGPEFGTVARPDLVQAAREAGDADFDALIACAFSYEARASELNKLGRIPVLKARMNADLHMAAI